MRFEAWTCRDGAGLRPAAHLNRGAAGIADQHPRVQLQGAGEANQALPALCHAANSLEAPRSTIKLLLGALLAEDLGPQLRARKSASLELVLSGTH